MANGKDKLAARSTPSIPFKFFFWGNVFDILRANGRYLIVCVTIIFSVYWISHAIELYAGQTTIANITLRIFVNIVIKWLLTMTVSGLSIALYFRERKQHENTRERLTKRITELELRLDTSRSSSQLTPKGRTRKGDE